MRATISKGLAALLLLGTLLAAVAVPAQAEFGVIPGTFKSQVLDSAGVPVAVPQAGEHPFAQKVSFEFNTKPNPYTPGGPVLPDGYARQTKVELPPGLVGNPTAVPRCAASLFAPITALGGKTFCPIATQVGIATLTYGPSADFPPRIAELPVFNLNPSPGAAATIGFLPTVPVTVDLRVRTGGDYGITAISRNISQAINFYAIEIELWGVPAAASHDAERYRPGQFSPGDASGNPLESGIPPVAFIQMPSQCGVGRPSVLEATSWESDLTHTYLSEPQEVGGCDRPSFGPSVQAKPDTSQAGAPAGLAVDVRVPQSADPNGVATPPVKTTVVTFPQGMAVNPSSANGLSGCAPDQIELNGPNPGACPESSKIGSVSIATPLLKNPVEGSIYLATQGTNPFNSLLAVYVSAVEPETSIVVKLAGKVVPDPATGRLVATFEDTPQLPFENFHLQLKGGATAPFVLPANCGTYTTHAEITSWARPGEPISSDSSFSVSQGCGAGSSFSPKLQAGSSDPVGGAFSPFLLRITREDGEQNLSRIEATLPEGVLAKLAGVPLCPDAQAASGDCPASSQVGTTTVGVGAGPSPIYVPQPGKAPTAVYLAGPYKGAPYSLVVKVPAQAGPFDLGTVTVRNGLYVDPTTTQVTAKSDPLPQILEGIPLSYRDVRVEINRPDFTVNPTSCEPQQVASVLTSIAGTTARPSARFGVADCGELAFKPKLALSLKGQMKRTGNPALSATLTAPAGQANIAKTTVILPKGTFIDQSHVANPCTRVQFAAGACPAKSILGTAVAYSPLLEKPLEGPVYFRSNGGERKLPDIVADLDGQIHVVLVGFIDSVKSGKETSRVRTRFLSVPDAPVSKFTIALKGGKRGLIENSLDLCISRPTATVQMTGQNGKPNDFEQKVSTTCGEGKKPKSKSKPTK
jgi:hypothetical protein